MGQRRESDSVSTEVLMDGGELTNEHDVKSKAMRLMQSIVGDVCQCSFHGLIKGDQL